MKFKIDWIFVTALCLVLALGIYINRLKRNGHQLEQENLYYKGNNTYLDHYGVALEQCLWEMGKKYSLKNHKLTRWGDAEQNTYSVPAHKLIINCCNVSDDTVKKNDMLEILRMCNNIPQLQVVTDSSGYSTVQMMLKENKNCQIWLTLNARQWWELPAAFFTDRDGFSYGNFVINSYTNLLFVRYLHFIQNQYVFE